MTNPRGFNGKTIERKKGSCARCHALFDPDSDFMKRYKSTNYCIQCRIEKTTGKMMNDSDGGEKYLRSRVTYVPFYMTGDGSSGHGKTKNEERWRNDSKVRSVWQRTGKRRSIRISKSPVY